MARKPQLAFSRGEIAPDLFGRSDTQGYEFGLATALNTQVLQQGGIRNRAGLVYLAPTKDHTRKVRLIPFEFGGADTHIIEMGHEYIRIMRADGHVTVDNVDITAISQADPVQVTTDGAHGYGTGDEVFLSAVGGMFEVTENRYQITVTGTNTFTLQDQVDGTDIDGTGFTAYTSGGEASVVFEIASPYQEDELFDVSFKQSFDIIRMAHPNHRRRELRRLSLTNWELNEIDPTPQQSPPTGLNGSAASGTGVIKRYAVTSVNSDGEEESLPALSGVDTFTITGITQANPAVVTFSGTPDLLTGEEIFIDNIVGMTELNGRRYRVNRNSSTQFELQNIDSTGFTAYTSGGEATPAFIAVDGGTGESRTIVWNPSVDTVRYNVYKEDNGVYAFLGETSNNEFVDDGSVAPNSNEGTAPFFVDPFFGEDNYPGVVGTFQQRDVYGGSTNAPQRNSFSQLGSLNNFNRSFPFTATDAFNVTIEDVKLNEIRGYAAQRDLLVFTSSGVWSLSSGNDRFSIDTLRQRREVSLGASKRPPVEVMQKRVVFEEENGGRIHAVNFSFASSDGFEATDLTLFSPHLFRDDRVADWSFVSWPVPSLFIATQNGNALALTYDPSDESQITGWCRWETAGTFISVASVRPFIEEPAPLPYFVVRRNVDGRQVQHIERLDSRRFAQIEDAVFLDSSATFDNPMAIEGVTSADPVVITITGHGLENGDFIDIDDVVWNPTVDKYGNTLFSSQLNGRRFRVRNKTTNTFNIEEEGTTTLVDGSDFPAYLQGGVVRFAAKRLFGFHHLRNSVVSGLLDGDVVRNLEVLPDGSVELPRRASRAHLGVEYVTEIETLPFAANTNRGQQVNEKIKVSEFRARVQETRGMWVGPDRFQLDEWKQREFERYGEPTRLLTGVLEFPIPADSNSRGQVFIRQRDPLPLTILSIDPDYST